MSRRRSLRGVLIDVERSAKRKGTTKALVPVDRTNCPTCKASIDIEHVGQPALFLHGGYGATQRTSRVHCSECGWSLVVAVDETSPRERAS